jgi:hypothetical protein
VNRFVISQEGSPAPLFVPAPRPHHRPCQPVVHVPMGRFRGRTVYTNDTERCQLFEHLRVTVEDVGGRVLWRSEPLTGRTFVVPDRGAPRDSQAFRASSDGGRGSRAARRAGGVGLT